MRRRSAFTLTEVLVALVVIAVIAGLAFPALAAARRRSMISVDISNMRQIGVAMALYAEQHPERAALISNLVDSGLVPKSILVSPLDTTSRGIANEYRAYTERAFPDYRVTYMTVRDVAGVKIDEILDSNGGGPLISLAEADYMNPSSGVAGGFENTYRRLFSAGGVQKRQVPWVRSEKGGEMSGIWFFTDDHASFPLGRTR